MIIFSANEWTDKFPIIGNNEFLNIFFDEKM